MALFLVDKPAGPTSHDVVQQLRRCTGGRRVGHGGTLDPMATGLLPIFVGRATRLIEYIGEHPKHYTATILLGVRTETDDAEGAVVAEAPVPELSLADLEAALAATTAWNRDIVCALRVVRNRLKGGMPPIPTDRSNVLRKMILEIEVKSEHVEQIALAAAVTRPADPALAAERRCDDAVINVATYFRRHGFTPDAKAARQVAIVLDPAFPEIGRAALEERCRAAATA